MHLNGIFLKADFLITVEAKVIILSSYVKLNETMAINKFQRSRLTVDLSAKVVHSGVPAIYLNIVFSQISSSIELKFHVKTLYDTLVTIYTKYFGQDQNDCDTHIW